MGRFVLIAQHNARSGQDQEFNRWYDTHVADVLRCPGFISAERFELGLGESSNYRYPTIYQIETDDLEVAKAAMRSRIGSSEMRISDSVDRERTSSVYWASMGNPTAK